MKDFFFFFFCCEKEEKKSFVNQNPTYIKASKVLFFLLSKAVR